MKKLSAVTFRAILSVLMVVALALVIGSFFFGYRYLQTIGEDTRKRIADASASQDSINNLQRLQQELQAQTEVATKLTLLRSHSTLPQFDTEKSLRTIANQLNIGVKNITFVDGQEAPAASSSSSSSANNGTANRPAASSGWGGSRNSRVSFEFSRSVSYIELITFLNAIETSIPKMRIDGISLPGSSSRSSVNPGTITLELATT